MPNNKNKVLFFVYNNKPSAKYMIRRPAGCRAACLSPPPLCPRLAASPRQILASRGWRIGPNGYSKGRKGRPSLRPQLLGAPRAPWGQRASAARPSPPAHERRPAEIGIQLNWPKPPARGQVGGLQLRRRWTGAGGSGPEVAWRARRSPVARQRRVLARLLGCRSQGSPPRAPNWSPLSPKLELELELELGTGLGTRAGAGAGLIWAVCAWQLLLLPPAEGQEFGWGPNLGRRSPFGPARRQTGRVAPAGASGARRLGLAGAATGSGV